MLLAIEAAFRVALPERACRTTPRVQNLLLRFATVMSEECEMRATSKASKVGARGWCVPGFPVWRGGARRGWRPRRSPPTPRCNWRALVPIG